MEIICGNLAPILIAQKESCQKVYSLSGVATNLKPVLATALRINSGWRQMLVIVEDEKAVRAWREQLLYWQNSETIHSFPVPEWEPAQLLVAGREWLNQRLATLAALRDGDLTAVICTLSAALAGLPTPEKLLVGGCRLQTGQQWTRDDLLKELIGLGYERVLQTDYRGQFSVRGGIIDIYPINYDWPIRLELLDDCIDSVREFNPFDQLSITVLQHQVEILPLLDENTADSNLLAYFDKRAVVIYDEYERWKNNLKDDEQSNVVDLAEVLSGHSVFAFNALRRSDNGDSWQIDSRNADPYMRQFDRLLSDIEKWRVQHQQVYIFAGDGKRQSAISESINGQLGAAGKLVNIASDSINGGFSVADWGLSVLSGKDLYGSSKQRRHNLKKHQTFDVFNELRPGDYVVHVAHGVGVYDGVQTINDDGVHRDYFLIRYAANDKLYVPVDQVNQLHRYIGGDSSAPRLNRLGSDAWQKAQSKARAATEKLARELLKIAAKRNLTPGHSFAADCQWQIDMENDFPYDETPDQVLAIGDIKADMELSRPMDRLLCGDVGFGKTEVALRAIFKAIMDGKQAALLAPTTVLAEQHYKMLRSRFAPYGVEVKTLNRFHSEVEQRQVFKAAQAGTVDVVIGTHRLLNSKLKFKDLGLLVIDEEQRFGVLQKEKMKRWQAGVDLLTMSATPIPRTLHMSLSGVRDISIIETPPPDRLPVQTYVLEYDERSIKQIIRREIGRGGQVYFLYNRVETIDQMWLKLSAVLPDINIRVAHGQMPDDILEEIMYDFYQGKIDVLLCTVLIENGLDVANANTLLVYDADRFGLAQLYQLKGRVGRSARLAYAYFTFRRGKVLGEMAEKRLRALQEFTSLGAGFKVAMRDLELRGAGNLLGPEQHGHIVNVGFEMYCRLLQEEMQKQSGTIDAVKTERAIVELPLDAWLPDSYVGDSGLKLDIYRQIAAATTSEEIEAIGDNLLDRFGVLPEEAENLLQVAVWARQLPCLGFSKAIISQGWLQLYLKSELPTGFMEKLSQANFQRNMRFRAGREPILAVRIVIDKHLRREIKDALLEISDKLLA